MQRIHLVMIVRNEARCLARCLASIAPWVDAMIVLDTGSSDDTVAIAQQAGAQVHHFTWVDDFSLARNAALDHSDADWNILLDADEWLSSGGRAVQALRQQAPTFLGSIEVASQCDEPHAQAMGRSVTASSWLPRVLPRGVRYTGRIHEQPHFEGPRQRLPILVGHDGYQGAQMQIKGDRNRRLLEAAVQAQPGDAYLHYQLGKDHEVHDRFEPALPCYDRALALLGPDAGRTPAWRHDLILRTLYVLKALGHTEQAIDLASTEMPHWGDSPDFYFVMGDVLLDHAMAHQAQADELIPMIEGAWQHSLAIGENPGLEGAVQGRGSHLAAHNLAALYEATGRASEAQHYRGLFPAQAQAFSAPA